MGGFGTKGGDAGYSAGGLRQLSRSVSALAHPCGGLAYVDEGGWVDNVRGFAGPTPWSGGITATMTPTRLSAEPRRSTTATHLELEDDFQRDWTKSRSSALRSESRPESDYVVRHPGPVITQATEAEGMWEHTTRRLDGEQQASSASTPTGRMMSSPRPGI